MREYDERHCAIKPDRSIIGFEISGKPKELAAYDDYDIWLGAIASDVPLNMINSSGHT